MRRRPRHLAAGIALLASVTAAACDLGPAAPHTTLTGDLSPVIRAFNADSGSVRAIFLASPT
jgi:hypothetical protein